MAEATSHEPIRQTGFLSLTITDASNFFEQAVHHDLSRRSKEVQLCGLRCRLKAEVGMLKGTPCLEVYLTCRGNADEQWTCKASCVVRVIHKGGEDLTKRAHNTFSTNNPAWIFEMISVEDLFNESLEYVEDDTVRIACTVSAQVPSAPVEHYKSKRRFDDVKIVLGDAHVFANKGMLAASCDYFETMFYGNYAEKDKEEVVLENVDANDFRKFLDVVYSSATQIDPDNIGAVLPLAEMFQARAILTRCSCFVVEELRLPASLTALNRTSMDDLKKTVLDFATFEELDALCEPRLLRTFTKETTDLILQEYKRRSQR